MCNELFGNHECNACDVMWCTSARPRVAACLIHELLQQRFDVACLGEQNGNAYMSAIAQSEAVQVIPTAHVHHPSSRLDFLDAIRGYAALAVFLGHAGLELWPRFREFDFSRFAIGNFGVILFFLCSGFIIPVSLERQNSLKRFWIRRLCRLFPLYWFSIFVCFVGGYYLQLNLLPADFFDRPLGMVAANATMLQALWGYPNIMGLYWTLFWEMVFYFLVSGLFLVRWHKRTAPVTLGLIVMAFLVETVVPLLGGTRYPVGIVSFLATMFCGTVAYRMSSGEMSRGTAMTILALGFGMVTITALGNPWEAGGIWSQMHLLTARITAFIVFALAFAQRSKRIAAPSLYLGRISYSVYLMHPIVMTVVPQAGTSLLTLVIWLGVLLLVASFTYRWIEQPGIALGQRLTS